MLVLVLNGPINAGKTTTGRALAAMLADAHFVDGDDHEAADDAPLAERISASFARIERMIGCGTRTSSGLAQLACGVPPICAWSRWPRPSMSP